ncbi:MAG TPA: 1-deoxy-D-xylulose-5-phosphate synthase, partial [Casimicrobiaceae bacterium]
EFGFNYIGPIDGHDLDMLTRMLAKVRALPGPQFLHVITKKGYGYPLAEKDPILYHGVTKFDPAIGLAPKPAARPTYTQVFSDWLCDMAAQDERIVGITPAMREGSGLVAFSQQFPSRYFDVGIAEQHAVTFAGGLACEGMRPVVAIYSTFMQRAYDQIIHDIALQDLPVVFAVDRAGVVGADGATHIGAYDLTFLRCIPGMTIMAPADENECRQMLYTAVILGTPVAVRFPRGSGSGVAVDTAMTALAVGKGEFRRHSSRSSHKVAILAFGSMLASSLAAGERLDATVANMRFVKPLDTALILSLARNHDALVTVEENVIAGGAGSAVSEALCDAGVSIPILQLGLPDRIIDHGDPALLLAKLGLDSAGLEASIRARLPGLVPARTSERV